MVSQYDQYGPVMLRIGLGVVYLVHGVGKIAGVGPAAFPVDAFAGFLGSQLGLPVPMLFAWIVALVETLGGIALLLGVLTRYAAALIAIDALVATLLVHAPNFVVANNGLEFTLVNLFAALALVLTGAGALSLERSIRGEEWVPRQLRPAT